MIFRARSAKRNPRRLSVRRRLTLEREIGTESAPPSQVRHWVAQHSEKPAARRFPGRAAAGHIAAFYWRWPPPPNPPSIAARPPGGRATHLRERKWRRSYG